MRICLIVDHPQRDLDGMVLLAAVLVARGCDVFLTPMYRIDEVLRIRPDFVLFNYVRATNSDLIRFCREAGIRTGVLDTEGAVIYRPDIFARNAGEGLGLLDVYCVWGPRQAELIRDECSENGEILTVTGCPRFDFLAPMWRSAVPDAPCDADTILVNTSFPLLHPRFQSREREQRELVTVAGFEPDYVEDLYSQIESAFGEVTSILRELAVTFDAVPFVVRPHPFEDISAYDEAFEGLSNIAIVQEGSVHPWLKSSALLIHYNCTTAIEAVMLGRETVSIDTLDLPLMNQPESKAVSLSGRSIDEIKSFVRQAVEQKSIKVPSETAQSRDKTISEWFHAVDGQSSSRVADAILEVCSKPAHQLSDDEYRRRVSAFQRQRLSLKGRTRNAVEGLLGERVYSRFKSLVQRRRDSSAEKKFADGDVNAVLGRLRQASSVIPDSIAAHPLVAADTGFGWHRKSRSIRISA